MQVSEQIIKVLEYLGDKVGIAIDWTAENILPYVEELAHRMVNYQIVNQSIQTGVSFILVIALIVAVVLLMKHGFKQLKKNKYSCWDLGLMLTGGIGGGLIVGLFIWLGCSVSELLKWIYLPEFQIVEYISTLLGTASGA